MLIGENVWTSNVDLAICTIEKANGLVNRIIEEKLYFDIGFLIIDEFHLVIYLPLPLLLLTLRF